MSAFKRSLPPLLVRSKDTSSKDTSSKGTSKDRHSRRRMSAFKRSLSWPQAYILKRTLSRVHVLSVVNV